MWWWWVIACAPAEIPYDGVDQDGDGVDLVDRDGDGFASELAFGPDCNDRDPTVRPDAADPCDGVDRDCDGADDGAEGALGCPRPTARPSARTATARASGTAR